MDYDITIVSGTEDFYLADALCRELEKSGKRCLFNWRDEKNPLKPSPKIIRKSHVFCLLLCNDVLNNSNLKALAKMHSGMKEVEEVVLTTDKNVTVPTDWKNVRTIDATRGLTPNIINGILNGANETICDSPMVDVTKGMPQVKKATPVAESVATATSKASLGNDAKPTEIVDSQQPEGQDDFERVIDTAKIEDLAVVDDSAPNTVKRAVHYIVGDTVPQDHNRAFELVEKARNEASGDVQTNYIAGLCYEFGIGNLSGFLAPHCYEVAMKGGHPEAALRCAMANIKYGEYEKAKKLIADIAKEGDKDASFMMGVVCEAEDNFDDAMEYYSESAEVGDAKSQNSLGCLYAEGKGVQQNLKTALNWFGLAAAQGLAAAHYNMAAILMADGPGSNTFEEGKSHLKEAASAGHEGAGDIMKELERQDQIRKNAEARREAEVRRKQAEAAKRAQDWEDFKRGFNGRGLLNDALNIFK